MDGQTITFTRWQRRIRLRDEARGRHKYLRRLHDDICKVHKYVQLSVPASRPFSLLSNNSQAYLDEFWDQIIVMVY